MSDATKKLRFTYQYSGRLTGRAETRFVEFDPEWLPTSKETVAAVEEYRTLSERIAKLGPEKESILSAAGDGGDLEKLALKIAPVEARLQVYSARQSVLAKAVRASLRKDLAAAHIESEKQVAASLKEKHRAVDAHKAEMTEALGRAKARESIGLGFVSCEQRRATGALALAKLRSGAVEQLLFACDRQHFLKTSAVGTGELSFDSNCDQLLKLLASAE